MLKKITFVETLDFTIAYKTSKRHYFYTYMLRLYWFGNIQLKTLLGTKVGDTNENVWTFPRETVQPSTFGIYQGERPPKSGFERNFITFSIKKL